MATVLVLHGPNLNLLGTREPDIYGQTTLETINKRLQDMAQASGHNTVAFQSNAEHDLLNRIHSAQQENIAFIIFNPAAFTHTSVALRDAITASRIPFIEVHLSNVYARESFRRQSFFSDIALGVISGFGAKGYELALTVALEKL
jgi:3-dehydroquinate dehydratase-2